MTLRLALAGAPGTGVEALQRALAQQSTHRGTLLELEDLSSRLLDGPPLPASAQPSVCLLMGLDALPPGQRAQAEPADRLLRQALTASGWPYAVVYGAGEQRAEAAWRLLRPWLGAARVATTAGDAAPARLRPCCPECLVPECEHRLFRFASKPADY